MCRHFDSAGDGGRPRRPAMATQLGSIKRVRRFPGFVVDGFNYQSPDVVAYFLTHFHADHTCGLHAGFKGRIVTLQAVSQTCGEGEYAHAQVQGRGCIGTHCWPQRPQQRSLAVAPSGAAPPAPDP